VDMGLNRRWDESIRHYRIPDWNMRVGLRLCVKNQAKIEQMSINVCQMMRYISASCVIARKNRKKVFIYR